MTYKSLEKVNQRKKCDLKFKYNSSSYVKLAIPSQIYFTVYSSSSLSLHNHI